MNSRLLTTKEKRFNRVARQRRKDQQKAIRRRQLALGAIPDPLLLLGGAALPGDKICGSFWQKDLRPLKRAIRELADVTTAISYPTRKKSEARRSERVMPRPSRVLRLGKRGAVPLRFLTPQPLLGDFLGADQALKMAAERLNEGADAESILQFLADPQATGLGLRACANLVQRLGLLTQNDVASAIKVVEESDAFQAAVADGRALFDARVANGAVEPAQGDWISVSRERLLLLLPGLHLPNEFRHDQFLANIIADRQGRPECLDIHATTFRGLCRHPLR